MKYILLAVFCFAPFSVWANTDAVDAEETDFHKLTSEDVDFYIRVVRQPVYPATLQANGIDHGRVSVLLEINYDGELHDWIVTSADHRHFAKAVENVIEDWEFAPPMRDGKPVSLIVPVQFNFKASGDVVSFDMTAGLNHALRIGGVHDRSNQIRISTLDELDHFPEALSVVSPEAPAELFAENEDTKGVFQFFIDTEGLVRLAHVESVEGQVDIRLLEATQNALEQWRFKPPTVKGEKVVVKAKQPFHYYARNN